MNEPMGWGTALIWGTVIVLLLLGLLVVAYLAFQNIIIAS
jgi:cytochrome c-type biogenesis protein CcmH/NrfF